MSRPNIRPILRDDVEAVVDLLHTTHMQALSREHVRRIVLHDWSVERPNYGYLLATDERVVGCILAAYSERSIHGRRERFCNVGTWYVDPEFRSFSLPLSWKLSALQGYTMTALTPNPTSKAAFTRSRYRTLADECHLYVPGVAGRGRWGLRARVTGDVRAIERELDPVDRQILRDHRHWPVRHFLLTVRGEPDYAYVVTRRWKYWKRDLVPVSEILYVSNKPLAARYFESLKLGILLRDRSLVLGVERRLLGDEVSAGHPMPRLRFFRSDTLEAHDVDNLYSEAVLL
jgi:hypothetical protein